MKKLFIASLIVVLTLTGFQSNAQNSTTNPPPTFIKGNMDIKFNTRTQTDSSGKPKLGVKDVYQLNVNVCNSAIFRGIITDTPLLKGGYITESVIQPRRLNYDMACDVMNPNNPAQVKQNIGKVMGMVPVDENGVYNYNSGTLNVSVLPMGNAAGFDSKFDGSAAGKPLVRPPNWLENLKCSAVNITKLVNGKPMIIVLKKYDKFELKNVVIGAGPVQIYNKVIVNGLMLYDYDKSAWFFKDVTVSYSVNNQKMEDNLTGTIIWSDANNQYDFDIRVNEPAPSESAAFSAPQDESAFFQTDSAVPSLTGLMSYKDTKVGGATTASIVDINLKGNRLTKQQTMVLCKSIIFLAIVPMNSD